jgi:hypothetical protein
MFEPLPQLLPVPVPVPAPPVDLDLDLDAIAAMLAGGADLLPHQWAEAEYVPLGTLETPPWQPLGQGRTPLMSDDMWGGR